MKISNRKRLILGMIVGASLLMLLMLAQAAFMVETSEEICIDDGRTRVRISVGNFVLRERVNPSSLPYVAQLSNRVIVPSRWRYVWRQNVLKTFDGTDVRVHFEYGAIPRHIHFFAASMNECAVDTQSKQAVAESVLVALQNDNPRLVEKLVTSFNRMCSELERGE